MKAPVCVIIDLSFNLTRQKVSGGANFARRDKLRNFFFYSTWAPCKTDVFKL